MKLPEFGVTRPVFTTMIFFGILIIGIVSYILLKPAQPRGCYPYPGKAGLRQADGPF